MKAPFGALFPALAIAAAIVAIVAGPTYAIAAPAAVAAVVAAALTIWETVDRSAPHVRRPARPPVAEDVGVRAWFRGGSFGREEIVLLVDRLERRADHPDLPIRSAKELRRLVRLPDDEFRAYVNTRLDAIEGGA
jgi:hypothetical protein